MRARINNERFVMRGPDGFCELLALAGRRNHCQAQEWARRVLLEALRREGLELPTMEPAQ